MSCYVLASHLASALCSKCGEPASPAHNVGLALFCAQHCPECGEKPFKEYDGEPVTVQGEQGGFGF